MKEIHKRILSGSVYVLLLIGGIIFHQFSFLLLFTVLAFIGLNEFQKLIQFKGIIPPIVLGIILCSFHFFNIPNYIVWTILASTLIVSILLLKDLLFIRIIPMFEKKKFLVTILYIITGFLFITLIPFDKNNNYSPNILLGMLILIWVNDSFAYLSGRTFGKHKLYSKISPNKTIEGFIGGFIATVLASLAIQFVFNNIRPIHWIIIAVITSIFGSLGDLIQSKFKRQAGVKDSGTIMPGHGGVFDRLDSLIYAAPFVYLFLQITYHVS